MPDDLAPATEEQFPWRRRRRFMYAVAAFCAATVAWCLWRDMTSQVAEAAVTMAFITLAGMVGSYVFGATWQDVNRMRVGGSSPAPTRRMGDGPRPRVDSSEDRPRLGDGRRDIVD